MARTTIQQRANPLVPVRHWTPRLVPSGLSRFSQTPLDVPGCVLWLAADRLGGLAAGTGIAAWTDLSGKGNHASQGTGGSQPTLVLDAGALLPAAFFNNAQLYQVANITLGLFTIYHVAYYPNPGATGMLYELGPNAGTTAGNFCQVAGTTFMRVNRGGVISGKNLVTTPSRATNHVGCQRFGGTHATHLYFLDGVQQATSDTNVGDPGSATATNTLNIGQRSGGSLFLTAQLHELLIYNGAHTEYERHLIEHYLGSRWGVSVA